MARCCVHLSSVCHLCIMAKRYILPKNCLKKPIELPNCYPVVSVWTPITAIRPSGDTDSTPKYLHCKLRPNMVALDSLLELTNALSNGTITDPLWTPVSQIRGHPPPKKNCMLPGSMVGYSSFFTLCKHIVVIISQIMVLVVSAAEF